MWWPLRRRRGQASRTAEVPVAALPIPRHTARPSRDWRSLAPLRPTATTRPPVLAPLFAPPVVAGNRRLVRELPTLLHRAPRRDPRSLVPAGQVAGVVAVRHDERTGGSQEHAEAGIRVRAVWSSARSVVIAEPEVGDVGETASSVQEIAVPQRVRPVTVAAEQSGRTSLTEAGVEYVGEPVEPSTPFRSITEFDRISEQYEQLGMAEAITALAAQFPGPVLPPNGPPAPTPRTSRQRPNLAQSRRLGIGTAEDPGADQIESDVDIERTSSSQAPPPLVQRHRRPTGAAEPDTGAPDEADQADEGDEPDQRPPVQSRWREPVERLDTLPAAAPVAPDPVVPPSAPAPAPEPPPAVVISAAAPSHQDVVAAQPPAAPSRTTAAPLWPRPVTPAKARPRAPRPHRAPAGDEESTELPAPQRPALRHREPSVAAEPVAVPQAEDDPVGSTVEPVGTPSIVDEPRDEPPDEQVTVEPAGSGPVYRAVLDDRAPVPPPARETSERNTRPELVTVAVPGELVALFRHELGVDVSAVPVHRGRTVSRQAASLGARAFARGGQVFLPDEAGELADPPVRALLAHELTHAVQQRVLGADQPSADSADGHELEAEADSVQRWVAGSGSTPRPLLHRLPPHQVREQTADRARQPGEIIQLAGTLSSVATLDPPEPEPEPAPEPTGMSWSLDTGFVAGQQIPVAEHDRPVASSGAPDHQTGAAMARVFEDIAELRYAVSELRSREPEPQDLIEFNELAGQLYQYIRSRLRAELMIDRERAGLLADVG